MEGERIASVALRPRAGVSLAWSAEVRGDERSKEDFFFVCCSPVVCRNQPLPSSLAFASDERGHAHTQNHTLFFSLYNL